MCLPSLTHRLAFESDTVSHSLQRSSSQVMLLSLQWFSSSQPVQLLSHVRLFATPWTAARQASLSITNFWSLLKLMSIKSVMPCNHLILCCPLFLLPSIFPSIKVFSNESVLHIRWPKYRRQVVVVAAAKMKVSFY